MDPENLDESHVRKANLLARYVIGLEGRRAPIKREELTKLVESENSRVFLAIFEKAQQILKETFGFQLKEVPAKETLGSKSKTKPLKTYMVVSILDSELRGPNFLLHSMSETETPLVGLTLALLSIIFINNHKISHAFLIEIFRKFEIVEARVMKEFTTTLIKQNYLHKITLAPKSKANTTNSRVLEDEFLREENEYVWGPRAKLEVSFENLTSFIKEVYGDNVPGNLDYHLDRFLKDRAI